MTGVEARMTDIIKGMRKPHPFVIPAYEPGSNRNDCLPKMDWVPPVRGFPLGGGNDGG
jgi:hypothetical protein